MDFHDRRAVVGGPNAGLQFLRWYVGFYGGLAIFLLPFVLLPHFLTSARRHPRRRLRNVVLDWSAHLAPSRTALAPRDLRTWFVGSPTNIEIVAHLSRFPREKWNWGKGGASPQSNSIKNPGSKS
jgi:hypothetical protein